MLWAKGYTELLQRLSEHSARGAEGEGESGGAAAPSSAGLKVDVYGSGPDLAAVQARSLNGGRWRGF